MRAQYSAPWLPAKLPSSMFNTEGKKECKKVCNKERKPFDADVVIAQLEVSGLGALPLSEWKDLVALRRSLPSASASILLACQFNACAGQV